ncbi:MAG: insulinase family protein [Pedobacter sp.]|nr:MAG: insulinase family protein [Pedobacter sp.]
MKKIFILGIAMFIIQDLSAQKLNRSQLPKAGPAPVIAFKDPSNFQLPNGITVLVVEDHKLPKVSASYLIDRGPSTEGDKAGVLSLMGSMLNEGTQNKTKLQFNQAVDLMGATVDLRSTGGSVSALTRYFEPAFMLMSEALRQPALHQDAFDKLKAQSLTGLKSNELNAQAISGRMVNALAYGKTHPMGEFVTQQSLESVTLDDIKKAYISAITPSRGILTIVGDIDPAAAKKIVMKALGDWKGVDLQLPELPLVSNPGATEIDVVDVKNAVQTEITAVSLVNLPMKSEDYHAVLLANQILGGGADAKLFRNLREKHGYTYGAYSRIGAGRFQSTFAANAAVRTEKTDSAIVEMLHEINIMRNLCRYLIFIF